MITNRLRGLVNLHVTFVTGAALLLLSTLAVVSDELTLDHVRVSGSVNLLPYGLCVAIGMVLSVRFFQRLASRFHRLTWVDAAQLATRQIMAVALLVFAFMFAFKDRGLSRLFMGTYLGTCWAMLVLLNQGLPRLFSRLLFNHSRQMPTLFIGSLASLNRLNGWLASKEVLGLRSMGYLTWDGNQDHEGAVVPFLGGLPDLPRRLEEQEIMQVIVLEIPRIRSEGKFIIDTCQQRGCRLLIHSNLAEQFHHPLVTVNEGGQHFYSLQEEPLEDPLNRVIKRLFDIAVSLPVVLFLLPPLTLLVYIMQRLQAPGPVFFVQVRTGHHQRPFRMLKFRSMYVAPQTAEEEARQAKMGDSRIYPFGKFLRRSSLDEFPQFVNVLLGDMSIVGPRPHLMAHDQAFSEALKGYRTRFFVKPGITGLAQSHGYRGEITDASLLEKRIEYDLAYISQWSVWLDLQITLKTARQMLFPPKTAY